jgi:hypothetical protein
MTCKLRVTWSNPFAMAEIVQALWTAGLGSNNKLILDWCKKQLDEGAELEDCTMYTYFYYCEVPRNGSVTFSNASYGKWKFAIEYLKFLLKNNKLDLNGVKVRIYRYTTYTFKTIKFGVSFKANLKKLNRLKRVKAKSITVNANGLIEILAE